MTPRIIFMGTPEHAVPFLEELCKNGYEPFAVITQPDRPKGRSLRVEPPPVKQYALSRHITVLQPENMNAIETVKKIRDLRPDLIAVVAYGQILKKEILSMPKYGCINVHFSLLPRHRGATPVQEALLAGDNATGVTIMRMDEKLDHGNILAQKSVAISATDTTFSLRQKLIESAVPLFLDTVKKIFAETVEEAPQDETHATYTGRLTRQSGRIDWKKDALEIDRAIRALNPWPGTWTLCGGKRIKIIEAIPHGGAQNPLDKIGSLQDGALVCGKGFLEPRIVQMEGRRPIPFTEFLKGYPRLLTQHCE